MFDQTPRTFVGTTTFQISGMTCHDCQRAVSEEIGRIPGICALTVELASASATVTAGDPMDRADIARAVDRAGYALIP